MKAVSDCRYGCDPVADTCADGCRLKDGRTKSRTMTVPVLNDRTGEGTGQTVATTSEKSG